MGLISPGVTLGLLSVPGEPPTPNSERPACRLNMIDIIILIVRTGKHLLIAYHLAFFPHELASWILCPFLLLCYLSFWYGFLVF